MAIMKTKTIAQLVERGKKEILALIAEETIPNTVTSFSDLHDYIDANELCGFCDEGYEAYLNSDIPNLVENKLHDWIASGEFKNFTKENLLLGAKFYFASPDEDRVAEVYFQEHKETWATGYKIYFNGAFVHSGKTFKEMSDALDVLKSKWNLTEFSALQLC